MKSKDIKILAIESSCDETAAAVIGVNPSADGGYPKILSNIVSSQVDLHALTGGVVPEVASRAHVESIIPVISEALITASQKISKSQIAISKQISNDKSLNDRINENCKLIIDKYPDAIKYLRQEIDYIAVTAGPGLIGSLLVGFNAAKTLAYVLDKPIIPVNHIEGHIYSALGGELPITNYQLPIKSQIPNQKNLRADNCELTTEIKFPILSLTVSGGHTSLTLMRDHGKYETLGETLDDAAGEAFDKVAKLLDLGYPGGPIVSKLASQFREKSQISNLKSQNEGEHSVLGIIFPRPILNDGTFNFSFSGLKTAVLQYVINIKKQNGDTSRGEMSPREHWNDIGDVELSDDIKQEICAAFEDAVVDVLVTKTIRAAEKYKPKAIILAGGVAANDLLRNSLESRIKNHPSRLRLAEAEELRINFLPAPKKLTGDNAAMIGLAAYYHILRGDISSWKNIEVDSNLELK